MRCCTTSGAARGPTAGTVVTIGAYDGVHLGHQAVIAAVRTRAADRGMESAVVTFDRHPASVVRPESAPRLLTDLEQKLELLAATGVDRCLVISFDEARSKEPAEEFVREVLVDCLGARVVIVGEDFHFGHQRKGNVALLRRDGPRPRLRGRRACRSSTPTARPAAIAEGELHRHPHALVEGDLDAANALLGRPHEVRGVVVPRRPAGPASWASRPPTCRCPATSSCPPTASTPAGTSGPTAPCTPAAISLGRRPTFYEEAHASLLEAHLLDFDGDLYDELAKVRFVARLRGEVKFDGVDALVEQIRRDCDEARAILPLTRV